MEVQRYSQHIIEKDYSPNVAPDHLAQHWNDRFNKRQWLAVGVASISDWKEITPGNGIVRVDRVLNTASFAGYIPSESNTVVETLGYYDLDDGGHASYVVDENDRSTPSDGGSVFAIADGRRVKMRHIGPVNVRWFGAKGDDDGNGNGHDDTDAIQAAINFAAFQGNGYSSLLGASVFIPEGIYKITHQINLPDGIRLFGSARGVTNLRNYSYTENVLVLDKPSAGLGCHYFIRDLTISMGVYPPVSGCGILIDDTNNPGAVYAGSIENVHVHGSFIGVQTCQLVASQFIRVECRECVSHGFLNKRPTTSSSYLSCFAALCGGDGYRVSGVYTSMVNCGADNNAGSGYHFMRSDGIPGECVVGLSVLGCGAENNVLDAMTFDNAAGVKIMAPYIQSANAVLGARSGIRINGGYDFTIDNAMLVVQNTQSGYGVELLNTLTGSYPARVTILGGRMEGWGLGVINHPEMAVIINAEFDNAVSIRIGRGRLTTGNPEVGLSVDGAAAGDGTLNVGFQVNPRLTADATVGLIAMSIAGTIDGFSAPDMTMLSIGNPQFVSGGVAQKVSGLEINEITAGSLYNGALLINKIASNLPANFAIYSGSVYPSYFKRGINIGGDTGDDTVDPDGGLAIGVSTSKDPSSVVQIDSKTRGVLIPIMTKAERNAISSPADGLLIDQSDATPGLRQYVSGAWVKFTTSADP